MNWYRYSLVAVLFLAVSLRADASNPLGKKTKTDPFKRLPELVVQVKADPDERKRAYAAEELRHFDPQQFPDLVPLLIDVLRTDPKTSVRQEALSSLSKVRPTSQEARQAIDKAATQDSSLRVRLQARTALMFYHVSSAPKKTEPQGPVLMPLRPSQPATVVTPNKQPGRTTTVPAKSPPTSITKEPPLANPPSTTGTSGPVLLPTNPPRLQTPPPSEGPVLIPPE